ncbi:tetratricopeptide repeat-containing sulfotransferase family protein [Sphingopyxis sp. JAI128]|uniref:tetratricopeptide repeat-containing sulfotransferase family protein n=1 Tax=Sphingopyxis sp. JAI128 TaxID=2723066 RepID=UPI00160D62C5|nr:tetratricopeptide repeat-containing sulfotransferase family protein [Sphingopyxis sp. JAI128]MBB6426555.1 tetratricopeptide (TPR) repeat protein [Sphingopyxis sp. JAI128]
MPMLDSLTADTLRQAMVMLQSGQAEPARALAADALLKGGDPVALNAFIGMLLGRNGDPAGAVRHLLVAHKERPQDLIIACNLISTQIEAGDLQGALAVATRERAFSDSTARVARYRGYLAQTLGQFEAAAEAYDYVIGKFPDDFESWNNLGNARQLLGDVDGGIAALERAVALDPTAPPARINLASALTAGGRDEEAERILRTAASDFPDDARVLYELYGILKRRRRDGEALSLLEDAARLDPGNAEVQFKLAVEYGAAMRMDDAERAYLNAVDSAPQMSEAYLGLAIQFEHSNREGDLAPLIERGEKHGLSPATLAFMRALEHRRAGRFSEALDCLSAVPETMEPERTTHIRATLFDRLGRFDEAFGAFEDTARLHQADPRDPLARAEESREELTREVALLVPQWIDGWRPVTLEPDRPDPVFLVGFPRSGTTLLDTILMGHPDTTVMEEKPYLNVIDRALGGISALPRLDADGIARARAQYFAAVDEGERPGTAPLLIDKSPLFLQKVPLIKRLFPEARFILALRHPCDVLLSCFMSNFRLNSAMANFLRLEDAAAYYDLTFQHWERSKALFPVPVHTIVYERLIADVEQEIRPLFDFLELGWDAKVLDHQRTAKARGLITTASYSQVAEPIYTRASGRWMHYRDKLEPILPTLAPWVEHFGYSL